MEDTLFIDRLEVVDELNLSNMITNNINAVVINKVNVKKHISQMENLYGGNIENLYITGNVTINNIHNVLSLNNINITKTLSNVSILRKICKHIPFLIYVYVRM